jgi:hypothetical protein
MPARNASKSRTASRYVSIVRSDLFSARRCRSKERVSSGSLGSDMAAPQHASQVVLKRYADRLSTT